MVLTSTGKRPIGHFLASYTKTDFNLSAHVMPSEQNTYSRPNDVASSSSGDVNSGPLNSKFTGSTMKLMPISKMNEFLHQSYSSPHSIPSQVYSKIDKNLVDARSHIENSPIIHNDTDLHAPLYRNVSMFKRVAETLERILETWTPKGSDSAVGSPEVSIVSTSSASEELDDFSPQRHSLSRRFSEDMLNYIPEVDTAFSDSLSPEMSCETHGLLTPKKASSQGSLTPRSPLLSPRTNQIEFLLSGRRNISEHESYDQICTILFSWCWPCPCSSTSGDIFLEN